MVDPFDNRSVLRRVVERIPLLEIVMTASVISTTMAACATILVLIEWYFSRHGMSLALAGAAFVVSVASLVVAVKVTPIVVRRGYVLDALDGNHPHDPRNDVTR